MTGLHLPALQELKFFFDEMMKTGTDIRKLAGLKIAAIGKGTQKALKERGLIPDLVPEVYDGASLGKALREACEGGERILIPRAKIGNHQILEELEKKPDIFGSLILPLMILFMKIRGLLMRKKNLNRERSTARYLPALLR